MVYDFTMVLTEFADSGVNSNSLELETTGGEEALGIGDQVNGDDIIDVFTDFGDRFQTIAVDQFMLN